MENNKEKVKQLLHDSIVHGYRPERNAESSCDWDTNWETLSEDEWDEVRLETERELQAMNHVPER